MSDNESIYSIVRIDYNDRNSSDFKEDGSLINEVSLESLHIDPINMINFSLVNIIKRGDYTLVNIIIECAHEFERNKGLNNNQCYICKWYPRQEEPNVKNVT